MKLYRNEWKYCCSEGELALLNSRLQGVLPLDAHSGSDGGYLVRSLYFDDYNDTCARDNDAGAPRRFKYRIRYYDDDAAHIQLERKEKYNGRCHKTTCPLTAAQYAALTGGDAAAVLWQTEDPLLRRFCADILTRRFTPKVIVDYERTAYVEPIANIRITLDRNIAASPAVGDFLCGDYPRHPLQQRQRHILEVKFDDILPGYLRELVRSRSFQQTTFSKYYLGRKKIEEILL